jgi:hypothetical protein
VAGDRPSPVRDQAELDERRRPILVRLAVERERICIRAELFSGQLVPRARVADLGLGDGRERDVLLEEGRNARPFRVAPAEDQLVVSERQQFLRVHAPP